MRCLSELATAGGARPARHGHADRQLAALRRPEARLTAIPASSADFRRVQAACRNRRQAQVRQSAARTNAPDERPDDERPEECRDEIAACAPERRTGRWGPAKLGEPGADVRSVDSAEERRGGGGRDRVPRHHDPRQVRAQADKHRDTAETQAGSRRSNRSGSAGRGSGEKLRKDAERERRRRAPGVGVGRRRVRRAAHERQAETRAGQSAARCFLTGAGGLGCRFHGVVQCTTAFGD